MAGWLVSDDDFDRIWTELMVD